MIRRRLQSQSNLKSRTRLFFLCVALPAWLGPGILDWYCHRRTHIEKPENGGLFESLIHSTMLVEGGLPLLLGALFELNPLTVSLMTGSAAIHELTAMADVRVALKSEREVSQWEQHVHSFLEVMPFGIVPLMVLLHEPIVRNWALTRRSPALSKRDIAIVVGAATAFGALPYIEELIRCARHLGSEPESLNRVEDSREEAIGNGRQPAVSSAAHEGRRS